MFQLRVFSVQAFGELELMGLIQFGSSGIVGYLKGIR